MPDALTVVLIAAVVVISVREAYRDERLGAALLVGVAVATLLLTLASGTGSTSSSPGGAGTDSPSSPSPRSQGNGELLRIDLPPQSAQ
ncbi:hypothetical protein Spla01_05700 [Streptomyces platensis]|uniref:Uncharacterized protein n=1 Tax=Streptomyces platensis TaxID=58346 RepID=A0ABX3XX45_STRPT|nr:hypothetical protein BG653_03218 [Streptomyces platensis]